MIEFFQQLHDEVEAIFNYDIETTKAYVVPTTNDPGLTFPYDADKKGKVIETCVLFIDIRNSTSISKQLSKNKILLGKLYSAFIHAMVHIADEYGYIRNIVGDRVMVVFEPSTCFENAINCAAVMYSAARRIVGKFAEEQAGIKDFKVGIGIDWGEMLILKTGKAKRDREASEYKGLVWVGDAANNASKLTDYAAKLHSYTHYEIRYNDLEWKREVKPPPAVEGFNAWLLASLPTLPGQQPIASQSHYEDKVVEVPRFRYISEADFTKLVIIEQVGAAEFAMKYEGKRLTSCVKQTKSYTSWSILISGRVYEGLKKAVGEKHPLLQKISKADYPTAPYVGGGVYNASLFLKEVENINK